MDILVKLLAEAIQPPWNYVVGAVALATVVFPRLAEVYREFRDARTGRRDLELEKLRLEVLKLHRELNIAEPGPEPAEAKRKLEAIPAPIRPAAVAAAPALVPPPRRGRIVAWLMQHPRFARPFLWISQAFMAYCMVTFAVGIVALPVLFWYDPASRGPELVFAVLLYGALGWASYKGFTTSRRLRKEISAS